MAQPTAYSPATDFSAEEASSVGGRSTVRTAALDAELSAIQTTLQGVLANLALIQRDDGDIRDGEVKLHTLAADVRALLAVGNVEASNLRGAWLTATAYVPLDVVTQSANTYIATTAHTSGTFATDLAAGRWILLSLGATVGASAVSFTPTATIAATTVQAAIEEADTENRALSAAASAAVTSLASDLADTASATKGAADLGYNPALSYAAGLGQFLNYTFGRTAEEIAAGVTPTNYAYGPGNVMRYGATGDGTTNDQAAIQAAANASRRVFFPQQSGSFYRCNSSVTLRQDTHVIGATKQNTVVKFFGSDGFVATSSGSGAYDIRISGLSIISDGTGSNKDGIRIDGTAGNFGRVEIENVVVGSFTRHGVNLIRPIVSVLRLVQSSLNGSDGFHIEGDGTSVHADTCYAASNGQDGWHLYLNVQYSAFTACASDSNTRHGWFFNGAAANPAAGITMNSCGSETNGGDQFKFGGTLGLTLNSIFTFPGSPSAGGHYINLDGCRHVTLSGIRMDAAAPATKYALNLGDLGGTQFPQNVRAIGCSFSSVNDPTSVYDDVGAVAESWVAPTFTNSWVNFGGSEATAGYYKDQDGVVHLKGTIKSGVVGSAAFTLPAGYRPAANRNFACASNSLFGYLSIGSTGVVTPAAGSNTWFALDGVYFRAEA